MATLDWPSTPAFRPMRMRMGVSTPKSRWVGFYSGQVQAISHFGSRLRMELTLPPSISAQDAAYREAFLMQVAARGDWVRLGHFLRPVVSGLLRGSPTVLTSVAAGATSITLTNALAGNNLLAETEAFNGPGWSRISGLEVTANTEEIPEATFVRADTLTDPNPAATAFLSQSVAVPNDSATYTASVYVKDTTGGTSTTFALELVLSGGTTVNSDLRVNTDNGTILAGTGTSTLITGTFNNYWLISVSITNNATGNTVCDFRLMPARSNHNSGGVTITATGPAVVYRAQLERAATMGPFAGIPSLLAGDVIAVGSQLMEVGIAGASQSNATSMVVPLAVPLRAAVTAGEPAIWYKPTGDFQLLDDLSMVEYLPGRYQDALTLTFMEAF